MATYFNYLSDPLYITINPSLSPEQYANITYDVYIRPYNSGYEDWELIYHGSCYYTGDSIKIYLNDIIESYMNNYEWFRYRDYNYPDDVKYNYVDVRVRANGIDYQLDNIINVYKNPNMKPEEAYLYNSSKIAPLTSYYNNVLPHFPHAYPEEWNTKVEKFKLPITVLKYNTSKNFQLRRMILSTQNHANTEYRTTDYYCDSDYFIGNVVLDHNTTNWSPLSYSTTVNLYDADDVESADVAIIDKTPAEYYLMWINRYGAIQCQGFCAKNILKESVSTSYSTNNIGISTPYNKNIDFEWTLNSHWLNSFEEYNEFESLLTSKYVWLYDFKVGMYHLVNVTDSKWEYRNNKNTNKIFNLTVNLKSAKQQNIIY